MTSLELEGDSLGQKHQHYNKLLKEAIENQELSETPFECEGDIENLLKIDIASNNRNVEYILDTFKSIDLLYVSRAIKKSTWLITDEQYAHIINVDYLQKQLFPHMMTKAINKLILNIRLHLKDETRVDAFYNYEKKYNPKNATKWLQYCSLSVIEEAVENLEVELPVHLLKRLCRRSVSVLEAYIRNGKFINSSTLKSTMFLMKSDPDFFLDIIDTMEYYNIPTFESKYTDIVMKACPRRILDNFEKYLHYVDYQTVAKNLNEEDVMDFLVKQSDNENLMYFFAYDNIKHFVHRMPKEGRFKCLKQIFIDRDSTESLDGDSSCDSKIYSTVKAIKETGLNTTEPYYWYEFAPFDEAFNDLKKIIRAETSASERYAILKVLLKSAGQNSQHIQTVLQYYHDKHINESLNIKIPFIRYLLNEIDATKLDEKTWGILDKLFYSMDVYTESVNTMPVCVETIIIHNAIHGKTNPKNIINKFDFNTLKTYINKLNNEEKEKVFGFLYDKLLTKIQGEKMECENDLNKVVVLLEDILKLFKDWDKDILEYPLILNRIEELIKVKTENKWNINLSSLYTINKAWRKHMFEQSIILCPTDEVCLNVLKHDAKLFSRYKDDLMAIMSSKEATSMVRVLSKLRVYWPHSLATNLKTIILKNLETPSAQKSIIKGLVTLLPQEQLLDALKKYAPIDNKINWGEDDEILINLRKHLAMFMHVARPSVPLEAILYYAKGDYLQYAVPSLSSVLHNLSRFQSGLELPKLLDAPVSLQKYGIRVAVSKLNASELNPIFTNLWKRATNPSIRAVLFKQTFDSLCAEKDYSVVHERWELLSKFMDNLMPEESMDIYRKLGDVAKVPHPVKGKFYMKSYTILKNLPENTFCMCEFILITLLRLAPLVMDMLDSHFVTDTMLKSIDDKFNTEKCEFLPVISLFLLCSQNAETQNKRYKTILCPLFNRYLSAWNDEHEGKKYVQYNFKELLKQLTSDLKLTFLDKKKVNPMNMFTDIQNKLEQTLSITDNYVMFTSWKLALAFVKLVDEQMSTLPFIELEDMMQTSSREAEFNQVWDEICLHLAPSFGKICCEYLSEDTERYFPTVFILFGKALKDTVGYLKYQNQFAFYKRVLEASLSIESYLLVINICPAQTYVHEHKEILTEIREMLNAHPSAQIKMHYIAKFEQLEL